MNGVLTMEILDGPFDFCECQICGRMLEDDEFEICRHCENKHGLSPDDDKKPDTPRREDDWQ